jgi:integrase
MGWWRKLQESSVFDNRDLSTLKTSILKSKSPSTIRSYLAKVNKWVNWSSGRKIVSIPADPLHVAVYLSELTLVSRASTVLQAFSAIVWLHQISGLQDLRQHPLCAAVVSSALRNNVPFNRKEPFTTDQITQLIETLKKDNTLSSKRLSAIILLGFSGFLRISETLNLRMSDFSFYSDHIEINISSSKTDIHREGNSVLISATGNITCPCAAVLTYIDSAKIPLSGSSDFIFRTIVKNHDEELLTTRKLSYTRVRETLRKVLHSTGLNPSNFGTHSLRSGGASTSSNAGIPNELVKSHGRWRSENAKARYIKGSLKSRLSVSHSLKL